MKKIISVVAVIALLIGGYYLYMYWALGNDSEEAQTIVGENLEGEADPSRMTLDMTVWNWQRSVYSDGREVRPLRPGIFTLTFKNDGTFTAATDCNSGGGRYTAGADRTIAFTDVFQTEMFCEGSQESEFFSYLTNASGYLFTSRGILVLDLKFDSGSVYFR